MATHRFGTQTRQLKLLALSLLLIVLVVISARATYGMYKKSEDTGERRTQLEAAVAKLESREDSLKKEVELIQTPRGLDKEIRKRYAVKKPGEGVIVIINEDQDEVESAEVEQDTEGGFWKFLGL